MLVPAIKLLEYSPVPLTSDKSAASIVLQNVRGSSLCDRFSFPFLEL